MESEVIVQLKFAPVAREIEIELLGYGSATDENSRLSKSMSVLKISTDDLLEKGGEQAAQIVGNAALSLFQSTVSGGIGYDESIQASVLSDLNSVMIDRAAQGDADAKHHVAIAQLLESVEKLDESLLQDAERLLREAAKGGSVMSKRFLEESWERISGVYLKEIKRRKDSDSGE